jgi:X-X-X-Leu-X-X-Gly heptad repeat protein
MRLPETASPAARLDVLDLVWRPYGRSLPVLAGITLSVHPGERILLTGPSGSGKSTLLRAIAGVLTSAEGGELSGSVLINGVDVERSGSSVGLLVQNPADAMVAGTVGREVAFGPENFGIERADLWHRVRESLSAVNFPYGTEHAVGAVSGGEGQRLALAGVLALSPSLIVLDEPTSMLDPASAATVREAIWMAASRSGATVVVVEHHLDGWLGEIDRVVVLDAQGRVAADGPLAETLQHQAASLERLGVWIPGAPAPGALALDRDLVAPAGGNAVQGTPVAVVENVTAIHTLRSHEKSDLPAAVALSDIDAIAHAGEFLAVVGDSGAGKSTLTALFAGLIAPSSGAVQLAGGAVQLADGAEKLASPAGLVAAPSEWASRTLAAVVGWVPQQAELAVVAQTVREDALSTSRALGLSAGEAEARVDGLLGVLGLAGLSEADPHQLSGGELRRLALVGAMAHGPRLLVLDEPTVGQDRHTWAAIAGVITSSRDAGVAVVVATHDPQLIELADRVMRLDHGQTVSDDQKPAATEPPREAVAVRAPGPSARRRSLVRRCGPLSLLGASILFVIGSLFISDVRVGAIAVAAQLLLAPFVCGWMRPSLRLIPGLLAIFSVGFSNWLLSPSHDIAVGLEAGLRVAFFVLPGIVIAGLIDPFTFGDHLAQRLRLPARPVIAAVAALQRIDSLRVQWNQLAQIRRVRGLDGFGSPRARIHSLGALTFALFVQSLRQSGRMAVAMDARGFSATRAPGLRRSWAEAAPWSQFDTGLLALGFVVTGLPVVLRF